MSAPEWMCPVSDLPASAATRPVMADMASAGIRAASKTPLVVWLAGRLGIRASGTVPEVISSPAWL